jgi:hypothetical protein
VELLVAALLLPAVAWFVTAPLRSPRADGRPGDSDLVALEAAKQAKYREIRDLELDRAAGKVDEEQFAAANAELRAEAIAILDRLDQTRSAEGRRPSAAG